MNGTDADVLIFLDCCAAAGSARSASNGMVEVIAASGFESTTPLRGKHTFTANLVKELQEGLQRSSPGTPRQEIAAVYLHTRLINRLKRYIPTDGREPRITPIHYYLAHGQSSRSIRLGKWKPIQASTQMKAVSNETSDGRPPTSPENSGAEMRRRSDATAFGDIWPDKSFQYDKVLLAINLSNDMTQDLAIPTFQQWLREVPAFVEYVNVEAVYRSRSTLLIASVSIAVWDLLPDHPATTFIGFVSSDNLRDLVEPRFFSDDPERSAAEASWHDSLLKDQQDHSSSWFRNQPVKRSPNPSLNDEVVYSGHSVIRFAHDSMFIPSTKTSNDLGGETIQTVGRSNKPVTFKENVPEPIKANFGGPINIEPLELAKGLPEVPVTPLAKHFRSIHSQTSPGPRSKIWQIAQENLRADINTYKYKDIAYGHEMRLLKVLNGKENDPLECVLFNAALPSPSDLPVSKAESHMYGALSYWWGNNDPKIPITIYSDTGVRGENQTMAMLDSRGTLYIRDNLAAALRQCRKLDRDINIWVDAICTNQENLEEKMSRLPKINQIYSGADEVLIWPGDDTDDIKRFPLRLEYILDPERLNVFQKTKTDPTLWNFILRFMKNR